MEVDKEIQKVQNEIQKVKNIMDIKKQILKLRKIKPNSINAYLIILKKLNDNRPIEDLEFLKNTENIMGQIQKKALTTRRNYIGALLVAVPLMKDHEKLLEFYQDELKIVNAEYQVEVASHKKSVTQEQNWMTQSGIRGIYNKYKVLMKREKYNLKESLTISEFNILTNFVVVSLYVLLKPVRLDFAPMKVIKSDNNDDDKSNFLVIKSRNIKYFIINEYKSSKSYGKIKIEVPSELNTILNLYLKFHLKAGESFLLNSRGGALTANNLSKLITTSFGRYTNKNITLNLLRHIFISENVSIKDEEQLRKEEEIAKSMLHSVDMQKNYVLY